MYRVVDWEKHYENFETKKIKHGMRWVPMPTKHDGLNFRKLMEAKNGIAHFGAFVLMVEVAAKCEPRGTLQSADGVPLSPDDLRIKTGCPANVFKKALPVLISIGWIEDLQDTSGQHPDDNRIASGQHPSTLQDITLQDITKDQLVFDNFLTFTFKEDAVKGFKDVLSQVKSARVLASLEEMCRKEPVKFGAAYWDYTRKQGNVDDPIGLFVSLVLEYEPADEAFQAAKGYFKTNHSLGEILKGAQNAG